MFTAETSVWNGRLPDSRLTEPNSPMARANASPVPVNIAGTRFGRMIRRAIRNGDAPSDAAAASMSRSSSINTGCTVRTTNGSVTNSSATVIAVRVNAMLTCAGLRGPYKLSSTTPATIVGNANGKSMNSSTTLLPGKSSRTSTHAMIVPITRLKSATPAEIVKRELQRGPGLR